MSRQPTSPAPSTVKPGRKPSRRRPDTRSVTLADVAAIAGVSTITASRALANPAIVSEATRRKVEQAVRRSGYMPNLLAGSLRSRRTRLIACLVPTISSGSAFLISVHALTEAVQAAGYQVLLGERGFDQSRDAALVEAVLARRPDGIVLTGAVQDRAVRRRLARSGIPVIETWDMTAEPVDMLVGYSHEAIGEAIAAYFAGKGRRHLAMIASDEPRGMARARGFCNAARRLGLVAADAEVPSSMVGAPTRLAHGRAGLADLVDRGTPIDALYCSTDLVAMGALIEARARGLAVPDRLAVVGFGDNDFAVDAEPALTSVHVDPVGIGRTAATMLLDRIAGRPVAEPVIDSGFSIIERDSG